MNNINAFQVGHEPAVNINLAFKPVPLKPPRPDRIKPTESEFE